MHTIWSRGNYANTRAPRVVAVVTVIVALIACLQLYLAGAWSLEATASNIKPKVTLRTTRRSGAVDGKPKENLRAKFDLQANLEPLFNWNTKQVFVYLTAEYPGARPDIENVVTLWDKIVTDKKEAEIKLEGANSKYNVWDVSRSFDNKLANLTLRWQVQPHVGLLVGGAVPVFTEFEIPSAV